MDGDLDTLLPTSKIHAKTRISGRQNCIKSTSCQNILWYLWQQPLTCPASGSAGGALDGGCRCQRRMEEAVSDVVEDIILTLTGSCTVGYPDTKLYKC